MGSQDNDDRPPGARADRDQASDAASVDPSEGARDRATPDDPDERQLDVTRPGMLTRGRRPAAADPPPPPRTPSPSPPPPTKRTRRITGASFASPRGRPRDTQLTPASLSSGGPGETLADRLGMPNLKAPVALLSLPGDRPFDVSRAKRKGRYLLGELLGEGGMGRVIAARELDLGRNVALKMLKAEHRQEEGFVRALVFEARLTGQLEHPHIVPVYDLGTLSDGSPYYTMKLVGDLSLKDVLRQLRDGNAFAARHYTLTRLLQYFRGACMAVEYAHARGVIHRDLKPDNILIGDYGEVQIMDWGVARVLPHEGRPAYFAGRVEEPGVIVGTPHYMAPEQARGDTHLVDARSDVYALGVVLYQILTWTLPWDATTTSEQLDALLSAEVPPPSTRAPERDIAPELERICVRAMAKRRAHRYGSARALWNDIEAFLEGRREAERLAELAEAQIVDAGAAAERYDGLSHELLGLEAEVSRQARELQHFDPIPERRAAWDKQLRADQMRLVEARTFAEAVTGFQRALAYQPGHDGARARLAELYRSRALLSRDRGDDAGFVLYADLERALRVGDAEAPSGTLHVRSYPEGAQVRVFALDGDDGDQDVVPPVVAPVSGVEIPAGSYVLSATLPSYREHRQPVVISPGDDEHVLVVLTPWDMSAPMIARSEELSAIKTAFAATVADSRLGSMMVSGAPGLGKARLLSDFAGFLDELPERVVYGVVRCTPLHAWVPLLAISVLLRHRAGIGLHDPPETLLAKLEAAIRRALVGDDAPEPDAAIASEIARVAADLASLPALCGASGKGHHLASLSPPARAARVFDAMKTYLRALAGSFPIVLAFRSAEHLDRLSRDLLFYLAEELHDAPLFCLMLGRGDRLQLRCDQRIDLRPLDRDRTHRQVELLLRAPVDDDVVALVHRMSEGNAFFVSESTRVMVSRGWIAFSGRQWRTTARALDADADALTFEDLLRDLLGQLTPRAVEALRQASVSHLTFWVEQVAEALGEPPSALDDVWTELTEHELIVPRPASRFRDARELDFRHDRLQQMIYEALPAERRRGGHLAVAAWLSRREDLDIADVALIAYHRSRGGDDAGAEQARQRLSDEASRWERPDAPAWFDWPEDLRSGLTPPEE